jgi:hypothetical protein
MSTQAGLFELPSPDVRGAAEKQPSCPASLARDEAIAKVEKNAAAGFNVAALDSIRRTAGKFYEFTTDEVIAEHGDAAATHDGRAWGAAMVKAQKAGLIRPTREFRNTNRASRHHAPIRIWRSLVYGGVR